MACGRRRGLALALVAAAAVGALSLAGTVHAIDREYFIQAERVSWNYAPSGINVLTGESLDVVRPMNVSLGLAGPHAMHQPAMWTRAGSLRVGRVYEKLRLVEYTDASFSVRVARPRSEAHLGLLAPTLRASVGDRLLVTFRNNVPSTGLGLTNLGLSLHPHGVFYTREHEGAPYFSNYSRVVVPGSTQRQAAPRRARRDASGGSQQTVAEYTTSGEAAELAAIVARAEDRAEHLRRAGIHPSVGGGSNIKYDETWNYTWTVPARAGPGPQDSSSVAWFYHSHVDEPADVNAALVGTIIVSDPARADPATARPTDVDRELVTLFSITDENASPMFVENFLLLPGVQGNTTRFMSLTMDEMFQQSNYMHGINGYVYGNLPGLYMFQGERVRWYVGTLGSERDIHGAHWHANTVVHDGKRKDSIGLVPAVFEVADMQPDNVGQWMYHCHTSHHLHGGMVALYEVLADSTPPITPVAPTCPTVSECITLCGEGRVLTCRCASGGPDITCQEGNSVSAATDSPRTSLIVGLFALALTLIVTR